MQAVIPNVAPNQNSKEGGDSRPFLPFFTGPAGVAPTPSQEDLRAVFSFFFFLPFALRLRLEMLTFLPSFLTFSTRLD